MHPIRYIATAPMAGLLRDNIIREHSIKERNLEIASNISSPQDDLVDLCQLDKVVSSVVWKWFGFEMIIPGHCICFL